MKKKKVNQPKPPKETNRTNSHTNPVKTKQKTQHAKKSAKCNLERQPAPRRRRKVQSKKPYFYTQFHCTAAVLAGWLEKMQAQKKDRGAKPGETGFWRFFFREKQNFVVGGLRGGWLGAR